MAPFYSSLGNKVKILSQKRKGEEQRGGEGRGGEEKEKEKERKAKKIEPKVDPFQKMNIIDKSLANLMRNESGDTHCQY